MKVYENKLVEHDPLWKHWDLVFKSCLKKISADISNLHCEKRLYCMYRYLNKVLFYFFTLFYH